MFEISCVHVCNANCILFLLHFEMCHTCVNTFVTLTFTHLYMHVIYIKGKGRNIYLCLCLANRVNFHHFFLPRLAILQIVYTCVGQLPF